MAKRVHMNVETCANAANHTPCPSGYLQWHDWASGMSKTHRQVQCPSCELWLIWVPKGSEARDGERD